MGGCTAVTVWQYINKIYCANTGDSRAMEARQIFQGQWKQIELSKDHKPKEKVRIQTSGGWVEQSLDKNGIKGGIYRVWKKKVDLSGLAMSRSMGDQLGRECGIIFDPEIIHHTLTKEDKMIVLTSDGVFEFLSYAKVNRILSPYYKDSKLNEGVEKLIQLSHKEWLKENESVDDITCAVYFINGIKEVQEENKLN